MFWGKVCTASYTIENTFEMGIDVSKWQGDIDWGKVKTTAVKFAIAKATEGVDVQDRKFLQNWEGMKNAGIKAAAYHYFRGGDDPQKQVTNINSVLGKCDFDKNSDILAIDVEASRNENVSSDTMALALKSLLEQMKDFKHIYIYCSPWYWQNKVSFRLHDFSVHKLWIADWRDRQQPEIPETWSNKNYTWWQYSSKGNVDGISGFVDLNRARGNDK